MASELRVYKIRENRLKKSFISGFRLSDNCSLVADPEDFSHVLILNCIDGGEEDAGWGRLRFNCRMDDDMVLTVYAIARNSRAIEEKLFDNDIAVRDKRTMLEVNDAIKKVNVSDMLLFEQTGRYLYIVVEVLGHGNVSIDSMMISNSDDFVMDLMPEIYQDNSFLKQYLAIFSSMIQDFQEKINHVDDLLDVNKAPKEFLPYLASWMGVDVSGDFLEEDRLRLLVKEAYKLNKMKGTRAAFERLTEIVLKEKAIVLEKNVLREYSQVEDQQTYNSLYGNLPYDVTLLIKTHVPENQKSQLVFLLNQFKPVRCRLLIRFLDGSGEIDKHSYLDMNALVSDYTSATLDSRQGSDDMILLEE